MFRARVQRGTGAGVVWYVREVRVFCPRVQCVRVRALCVQRVCRGAGGGGRGQFEMRLMHGFVRRSSAAVHLDLNLPCSSTRGDDKIGDTCGIAEQGLGLARPTPSSAATARTHRHGSMGWQRGSEGGGCRGGAQPWSAGQCAGWRWGRAAGSCRRASWAWAARGRVGAGGGGGGGGEGGRGGGVTEDIEDCTNLKSAPTFS